MHATRQWQEASSVNILTPMLNKWMTLMCPIFSNIENECVKEKLLVEANLLHIKAAACGRLKSSCAIWSWVHVWLWYVMTTGEHLHTCLFSLWRLRCLSHTHTTFLPNTSEEPLGEKKKKKNRREEGQCKPTLKWATSRIQTAAFDDSWFYFLGTLLLSNILQRIYQLKYFTITVETITYCIHYSMGWWW